MNPDNILIDSEKNLHIIDFADAVLAPIECEYALIASQIFCYGKSYMKGFFGEKSDREKLIHGLLLHPYGGYTFKANYKNIKEVNGIDDFFRINYKLMDSAL
jgi:hypothetical protein